MPIAASATPVPASFHMRDAMCAIMEVRKASVHRYSAWVHIQQPIIALFAKYPRAGEVNTRLIPALGEEGAAALHRTLVEQTLATAQASGLPVTVWFAGAMEEDFAKWLGPIDLRAQKGGGLGERLGRVPAPCILLGADVPDLAPHHLQQAAAALHNVPVAIGPAEDGGYYALAMREAMPFLFANMPWGGPDVRAETVRRLEASAIPYRMLDMLADCDRPEDLAKWPDLTP